MKAIGIHVFAGGFSMGVRRVFDVTEQLEIHGFGRETVEQKLGMEFTNVDTWKDWPDRDVEFAFGNPRCTGFSRITCGYDESAHGAWSSPTQDIWDFCHYVVGAGIPVAIWESVQQAYSVGRPLLDALRDEVFVPAGYRIAHVLLNYASFGNVQQRERYFFVAYKGGNFNIEPPVLGTYRPTTYDALWSLRDRETHAGSRSVYDFDTYYNLGKEEWVDLHLVPPCEGLNGVGRNRVDDMCAKHQNVWHGRRSDMPFSLHCMQRQWWTKPFSTVHSSACRYLHPSLDRPVTVGELATVMGWGDIIPAGKDPIAQLAKGVVPEAGEWLAQQAKMCLESRWGTDDFESTYSAVHGRWAGRDTPGAVEKTFNMTQYYTRELNLERYPDECFVRYGRENVDLASGRLRDPWAPPK